FIQEPFSLEGVSRFNPIIAAEACQFATGENRWKPLPFSLNGKDLANVKRLPHTQTAQTMPLIR
ncbi:hypothetical protein MUP77_15870, partial [Candidatus Bathyarchaeota archaeon]|nr:hypothetical protein [Candidatus Bathyarchaeota archaeon]